MTFGDLLERWCAFLKKFLAMLLFLLFGAATVQAGHALMQFLRILRKPSSGLPFEQWVLAWNWPGKDVLYNQGARTLFWTLALYILLMIIWRWRYRIIGLRISEKPLTIHGGKTGKIEGRRGLVAFLSRPHVPEDHQKNIQGILNGGITLEDICEGRKISKSWNWQTLFMAINACKLNNDTIHVTLLTSEGEKGTDKLFLEAKQCIDALFNKEINIEQIGGVNFFKLSSIRQALERALHVLHSRGVADREILIDITNGTGPCSAMGSIFASERGRRALYSGRESGGIPKPQLISVEISVLDMMKP